MLNFGNKEFRNLQEQVLKNAQDIELLKGRSNLQIVIVEALPEEGNPNYIYLVARDDGESPDVYDEYIWLADEERYELIGGVSIDLTNYAALDGNNEFTGSNVFTTGVQTATIYSDYGEDLEISSPETLKLYGGSYGIETSGGIHPQVTTTNDIGSSDKKYKDFYLGGDAYFDDSKEIRFAAYSGGRRYFYIKSTSNTFHIGAVNITTNLVLDSYLVSFLPEGDSQDLGNGTHYWRNLYLTGNISDGANTVSVANIASKTTSTQASGTFDANGEDTIDISGGTPTGLFIFAYGNCECFVHLTATMVQNADLSPIKVACPMIYNSGTVNGWLNISRSSDTLTISVIDGTNHVDSGYAWTLTKTNLI